MSPWKITSICVHCLSADFTAVINDRVAVSRPPALPRSSEPSPDFIDGGYPTHSPDLDQFKNFDWIRNSLTPERNLPLESSVQAALKNPSSGSALDSKHSENKGERGKEKSSPPPLVISDGEHNEGASARTVATKDRYVRSHIVKQPT